ncbi:MAG: DUF2949 domain-containing protein [Coleofasciculus sp. S288]|nr:DUF2949 domain-containing protein [Coleofasciculus sp. S288]
MNCYYADTQFIDFLRDELALSTSAIDVGLRQRELDNGLLPMILWQYGLVSIEQLARIFDWLEDQYQFHLSI